jgi:hypothetical protein
VLPGGRSSIGSTFCFVPTTLEKIMAKFIAFVIAAVAAWLAFGAASLHEKNPAHYGMGLPLALGAVAVIALLFVFAGGKAKAKSSRR